MGTYNRHDIYDSYDSYVTSMRALWTNSYLLTYLLDCTFIRSAVLPVINVDALDGTEAWYSWSSIYNYIYIYSCQLGVSSSYF